MGRLKLFYHNHRTWFYNLQYIGISILLMILVSLIDLRILPLQPYIPDIFLTKVDLAKSILTTMAGALLTITTFTFSTILTVMSSYASNFSPRTVENFVNMKITMKVLGIFVGGFFYCISTLLLMRDAFDEEQVFAGVVAIFYSIVCIIYFIIFVQKVIVKFQGVNLVSDICDEAAGVIEEEYLARRDSAEFAEKEDLIPTEVYSNANGYLSVIDYERILDLLEDYKGMFRITARLGDYITEGQSLGRLSLDRKLEEDELAGKLAQNFFLQDQKVSHKDYRYNLTKLNEIVLRALSSGVNDPNTATHVIRKLGVTMAPLASTDNYHIAVKEKYGCQVFYTSYPFKEDLYDHYSQIVHYGADDAAVMRSILESLKIMYGRATEKNKKHILDFAAYVHEAALTQDYLSLDEAWLEAAFGPFKAKKEKLKKEAEESAEKLTKALN